MRMIHIIPAALLFALFIGVGLSIGPRASEIDAYMGTTQYKAEQAAHFAKIESR